jgi:two-component system chemotaxis sensor kinase CheA
MPLQFDATPEELQVFLAETDELLQGLDEQLVRLERAGASPALLQEVFRAAHTIKGGAAAIGHTRMATLTHALETLLDRLRRGELGVSAALVDRLFEALDALRVLAEEIRTGEPSGLEVAVLAQTLEQWTADEAEPLAGATAPPVDPPGGAERVRATELPMPQGATHHVLFELEESPWAAVRALQALLALDGVAEVLVSHPSRADIERQQVDRRVEAWLACPQPAAAEAALRGVPEVHVLRFQDAETALAAAEEARGARDRRRAAEATEERSAPARAGRGSTTVRIDVERLDHLLNLVGELVIDRTRLAELGRALREQVGDHRLVTELAETTQHLGRVTDELQAEVMKSRMLPVGTVFSRFPRVVRDLASRQGKQVDLVITGQETELDRSVIEEIGDPLVHLLRNAIDHGVEPPDERRAVGKPPTATVRLAAEHVENSIVITVEDDGRGIDPQRVRARAVERGMLSAEAAARLSDSEAVDLIFAPGFSTAAAVTDVSGRGVGMDIVRANVERLGGSVEVHTRPGQGTRFQLRLPLTLAIVQTLLVRVGGGVYALPLSSVTETLRVPVHEVQRAQRQEAILLRGMVLPLVRLATVFGCASEPSSREHLLVVAVRVAERQVGLVVDALLGEQEVVIKALGELIGDVPGISSAAILGDGTVALIVDVPNLLQALVLERVDRRAARGQPAAGAAAPRVA